MRLGSYLRYREAEGSLMVSDWLWTRAVSIEVVYDACRVLILQDRVTRQDDLFRVFELLGGSGVTYDMAPRNCA
jgi:hypothetical protein